MIQFDSYFSNGLKPPSRSFPGGYYFSPPNLYLTMTSSPSVGHQGCTLRLFVFFIFFLMKCSNGFLGGEICYCGFPIFRLGKMRKQWEFVSGNFGPQHRHHHWISPKLVFEYHFLNITVMSNSLNITTFTSFWRQPSFFNFTRLVCFQLQATFTSDTPEATTPPTSRTARMGKVRNGTATLAEMNLALGNKGTALHFAVPWCEIFSQQKNFTEISGMLGKSPPSKMDDKVILLGGGNSNFQTFFNVHPGSLGKMIKFDWYVSSGLVQPATSNITWAEFQGKPFRTWKSGGRAFEPWTVEVGICYTTLSYMGVSKNRGTPKWMVCNGKPYENGWFGVTTFFGNIQYRDYKKPI